MDRADVLVFGGGPAGSAVALALAREGLEVVLVERSSRHPDKRSQAFLPASARLDLEALGVWARLERQARLSAWTLRSVWGTPEPYEQDFAFSPYGCNWLLDRPRFDATLLDAAADAGVGVVRDAKTITSVRRSGCRWSVELSTPSGERGVRAAFVVDATGRSASFARRQGAVRHHTDNLVGISGVVPTQLVAPPREPSLLIEASENGWWYSMLVPDGSLVAVYLTDGDMVSGSRVQAEQMWLRELGKTACTATRMGALRSLPRVRTCVARSSRLDKFADHGWLAAGDSAISFDPLASQGICHALESGIQAARQIKLHLLGDKEAIDSYALYMEQVFERYQRFKRLHYGNEARWPDSVFWARRHEAQFSASSAK